MKLWYRFVCAFVAVAVVLFAVRVPDVDADEDILTGDKLSLDGFIGDESGIDDYFFEKFGTSIDDYYYICFGQYNCTNQSNYGGTVVAYIPKSDYLIDCLTVESSSDDNSENYSFTLNLSGFSVIAFQGDGTIFTYQSFVKFCFNLYIPLIGVDAGVLKFGNALFYQTESSYGIQNEGIYTNLDINAGGALTFTVNPDLFDSMDMNNLNTNFTIDVENETDNAYNYCIYISSQPASVGIVNSLQSANYFLSSKQWCYVFQQDYQLDADLLDQIKNNVSDNYTTTDILDYMLKGAPITNLTNVWGGIYNGAKEYITLKNNSMSFYSLVQTNCPVYAIGSNATKTHVVDYACLNVNLDTQYYLNIIYYHPDMNIVAGIESYTV